MTKTKQRSRKPSELDQQLDNKRKRIEAMYPDDRVKKILRTEGEWGELSLAGDTYDLLQYDTVHRLIYGAAYRWARAYHNKRIPFEDFLSAFYEAAWRAIESYTWATDFYLYETLSRDFQSKGRSIIRAAGRHKRRAFHEALPLYDGI